MGRRKKCRMVGSAPDVTVFKPQGVPQAQLYGLVLGLDGFEALRLVDAEGQSQEEAAGQMGVSRPTLCRILQTARSTVARALSRGWALRIETEHAAVMTEDQREACCRREQGRNCVAHQPGGRRCQEKWSQTPAVDVDRVAEAKDADRVAEARDADRVAKDVDRVAEVGVSRHEAIRTQ